VDDPLEFDPENGRVRLRNIRYGKVVRFVPDGRRRDVQVNSSATSRNSALVWTPVATRQQQRYTLLHLASGAHMGANNRYATVTVDRGESDKPKWLECRSCNA
jgi:hypothetical protein